MIEVLVSYFIRIIVLSHRCRGEKDEDGNDAGDEHSARRRTRRRRRRREFSSSSFPPSSEEGGPFVFATTEASSCWSSPPPSSGEEEDEGDNEGIVSFSSFRNHSVGNPGNGGGNVTLFRMSVAKLPEVKSQL